MTATSESGHQAGTPDAQLRARWDRLVHEMGGERSSARSVFEEVRKRYGEAGRHYHNRTHAADVLRTLDELRKHREGAKKLGDQDWLALRLAAWFHDVVYDPRAKDNEARSADYARLALARIGGKGSEARLVEAVRLLILATRKHERCPVPGCGMFLDADLAILGRPARRYDEYAAAIRKEYRHVPEASYATTRSRVLRRFLKRPRLYFTSAGQTLLEAKARQNLRREITRLAGPKSP